MRIITFKAIILNPFTFIGVNEIDLKMIIEVNKNDMKGITKIIGIGELSGYYVKLNNSGFGVKTWRISNEFIICLQDS